MAPSDFFKQGDIIVNAEIDRLNRLRVQIGLKPISKRRNSKSNQMVRMMLSAKQILNTKSAQDSAIFNQ